MLSRFLSLLLLRSLWNSRNDSRSCQVPKCRSFFEVYMCSNRNDPVGSSCFGEAKRPHVPANHMHRWCETKLCILPRLALQATPPDCSSQETYQISNATILKFSIKSARDSFPGQFHTMGCPTYSSVRSARIITKRFLNLRNFVTGGSKIHLYLCDGPILLFNINSKSACNVSWPLGISECLPFCVF